LRNHLPTPFHCELSEQDGSVVVTVQGEVDLATATHVTTALAQAGALASREIVLDLTDVVFLDSSGLRAILSADAEARAAGVGFEIVPGPPPVQRVFEIAGLDEHLHFR
jgi:anti-anti-sigma factor